MRLIAEGIMTGQLPWTLVIIGIVIAIFCAFAQIPILPVALGLYLPISLNSAIFFGGIIRKLVEMKFNKLESERDAAVERGILISSGLVAGDAITGILIGIFAALNMQINFLATIIQNGALRNLISLVVFLILGGWLYRDSSSIRVYRDI